MPLWVSYLFRIWSLGFITWNLGFLLLLRQLSLICLPARAPACVPFPNLTEYGVGVLFGAFAHAAVLATRFHGCTSLPRFGRILTTDMAVVKRLGWVGAPAPTPYTLRYTNRIVPAGTNLSQAPSSHSLYRHVIIYYKEGALGGENA